MEDEYRDIFLSHSNKDKDDVRKLAQDLKNAGAKVWFDEWDIKLGKSIIKSVENGLFNSKFVGIWITKNAINSGWVEKEWQSKLKDEIEKGDVTVSPLLAEKCQLPLFLQDKLYADFTENYDTAFSKLLRTIKDIEKEKRENVTREFISMFLGEREKKSLQKINQYYSDYDNPIYQLMIVLDKIDPIINIWRYIHHFRGQLDSEADGFLRRMKDFFDYPEVKEIALKYKRDQKIYDLVVTLQDRDIAKSYYKDRKAILNSSGLFSLPNDVVIDLIEGRNIIYTIARGTGNNKPSKGLLRAR